MPARGIQKNLALLKSRFEKWVGSVGEELIGLDKCQSSTHASKLTYLLDMKHL